MSETPSRADASARVLDQIAALGRHSRTSSVLVAQLCGIQPAQVQVLLALHRATECRVADLADLQLVDPSVVSRQTSALERAGLIGRRPDPQDRRASLVSLTDAGRERVAQVRGLHVDAVARAMADWPVSRSDRRAGDLADLVRTSADAYARLAASAAVTA